MSEAIILNFPLQPAIKRKQVTDALELMEGIAVIDVVKTGTFKRYLELRSKYVRDPLISFNSDF